MVRAKSGVEGDLAGAHLKSAAAKFDGVVDVNPPFAQTHLLTWHRIKPGCLLQRQRNVLLTSFTPTHITAGRNRGAIGVPRAVTSDQLWEH
jgi:hypothetical protein